ncbi:MAG: hypothetical protein H0T73_07220, partial [Ardenticatenales bacterium]|nr:hypothetical protein [Ardenticatenales bacterium]
LDAPLFAIGMPRHFIVRFGDEEEGIFIDPFNQGSLMTREDCQRWLAQQSIDWREEYLRPVSDYELVERMLRNLVNAYAMERNEQAVMQTVKYLEIWTDFPLGG